LICVSARRHDVSAFTSEAGLLPNLLRDTFRRLEDRMEVVFLQKLFRAESKNIVMNFPPGEFRFETAGPLLCFVKRSRLRYGL